MTHHVNSSLTTGRRTWMRQARAGAARLLCVAALVSGSLAVATAAGPQVPPEPAAQPAPTDAAQPSPAQPGPTQPAPAQPVQPPPAAPPSTPTPTPRPRAVDRPVPATTPGPSAPAEVEPGTPDGAVAQADESEDAFPCSGWSRRPVFKLGQGHLVRRGESVRDAVVVMGSARVEGEVCGDLVAVLGDVELGPEAYVRDSLTLVGGRLTVAEGARVEGDLVVVGGAIEAPVTFAPGREQVLVGVPFVGDRLLGIVPWLTRGLLYGRLIVPDLAWNWWVVAITLFVVVVLNLLFPRAAGLTTSVIQARPLSAFAAGLLVLLLSGPVITLLAVTVIGVAVIPFVTLGMFAAWVVGSIGVARWIGASLIAQDDPDDRVASTRSVLIGFIVKVVAYMIPLVGLTTFALSGVLGLGAATMAFIGAFRAENPRKPKPPTPPAPGAPPPIPGPLDGPVPPPAGDAPHATSPGESFRPGGAAYVATGEPLGAPLPSPPASGAGAAPAVDLRGFPRGSFLERLGAFVLDVVLVALINDALDLTNREGALVLLLLVYHVAFWAWKGTTIGGIITQLRLVRVDGRPLEFTDALVRGLTAIFSLGALGIGCLWILRDEQRQSWHDLVAGTLVVRVPRGWPLP